MRIWGKTARVLPANALLSKDGGMPRSVRRSSSAAETSPVVELRRDGPAVALCSGFPCGFAEGRQELLVRGWAHEQVHRIEVRDGIGIAAAAVLRPADRGQAFELSLLRPSADPADIWELEIRADAAQTGGETVRFSIALRTDGAAVVEGPIWDTAADGSAPPAILLHPERTIIEADGTLSVRGWVVSEEEIAGFRLDGNEIAIESGFPRPDVATLKSH